MKDLDLSIFIGMSRTINYINRESDKIFYKYDLTRGQFAVLEVLYNKGPLTIGCVQDLVLTTGGNIPVIISNLEKKGYLTRCRDKSDRRKYILTITESGKKLMYKVFPENKNSIKSIMNSLSEKDKLNLLEILQSFRRDISEKTK
ncbi:MarR family winged helix-turn-helix transcriptional regulator [Peptostreptococcus equinus]|uniref:HTH-type transcriptional regulator SarZ n=1 Tax=Peptostreptococcus equinus TaxID=3003601 RepID=A0ABY7JQJ1_9FIRM|nr:MarR family transcriptional regulator [Peptostreptococcus sp. CBA3647]WAW14438.1 MarR family transcriptional regulator [Peptostreptococcus sp. CBA3647]